MPPSTGKTDFFLGTWNAASDTFTQLLDLNDGTTFAIQHGGLQMPTPEKTVILAGNVRSNGSVATRTVYKERHITVKFNVRGASSDAIIASVRTLYGILETNQFCIRFAWPGGSNYSYADVIAVNKSDVPYDAQTILAKASTGIMVDFLCATGLRGDRITLQNLCINPGFSAPSGPGVTVFNDTFANTNAYAVQSGSVTTDKTYYSDVVFAQAGATLLRYYRLGEASGTSAADAATSHAGTYVNSPTLAVAGALTSDSDTAITLAAASSQRVSVPNSGMPTGNGAISFGALLKFASNPASNQVFLGYGVASGNHLGWNLYIDSSGKCNVNQGSGSTVITSAGALATGAYHLVVFTWDGTTGRLYIDNAAVVTGTPGTAAIASNPTINIGSDPTPATYFSGQVDEVFITNGTLSAASVSALFAAITTAPATDAHSMQVSNGGRVKFGSPDWNAYNLWSVRLRYYQGATSTFYLHYTDANNYLAATISGTAFALVHTISGTPTTLATTALSPGNECAYWLQVTQFPQPAISGSNLAPGVQATLYRDAGGALSAQVAALSVVATQDSVTALLGAPQIASTGAVLGIGGNYSNVHTVALFGPGGWNFNGLNGSATGAASGAWELNTSNTYPSGPITSVGAARIDLPPAGTVDADWRPYQGGAAAGTYAIPVKTAGDVMAGSVYVRSSGTSSASITLQMRAYDASGTALAAAVTLQTLSGTQSSWVQMSGTYTTPASTAYVTLLCRISDGTTGSANGIVWFDNAQCWDATTTGVAAGNMPYCELWMPQSPGQFLVSGLLGDIKAPAHVSIGSFFTSWAPSGPSITYALGRRAQSSASPLMVNTGFSGLAASLSKAPVLSSASYGGYYWTITGAFSAPFYLNLLGLSSHASDMYGNYHLFGLGYSSETAGTNISNVQARTTPVQATVNWYSSTTQQLVAMAYGGANSPLSAQSTWTLVDYGPVSIPTFAQGGVINATNNYTQTWGLLIDNNGTNGQVLRSGFLALIPVDGEALLATAYNQTNSYTVTNQYHWIYIDGTVVNRGGAQDSSAWTFSDESVALANPANGYGGTGPASLSIATTLAIGSPNINPAGDPYLYLDPTQDSGTNANQMGVNELAGLVIDSNGALYNMALEFRYSPLYLAAR